MRLIRHILYFFAFWIILILIYTLIFLFRLTFFRYLVHYLSSGSRKILYLAAFYPENAGYEYRVRKWTEILKNNGYDVKISRVFDKDRFGKMVTKTDLIPFQLIYILKRFCDCFRSAAYSTVIVRRTMLLYNEYGGIFMERLLHSIHPNVILDIDDDTHPYNADESVSTYGKLLLEDRYKFYKSLGYYGQFIAGSEYLRDKVLEKNDRIDGSKVLVVPTCVDYSRYPAKDYCAVNEEVVFGWIGTAMNQVYLHKLVEPLNRLNAEMPIRLIVISGEDFCPPGANFPINNLPWSLESEIQALYTMDIGLMPLEDTIETRGKCGFKLIQYMGLGIPGLADAITVNNEILDHGINGLLVQNNDDWYDRLREAALSRDKWSAWGDSARKKIASRYNFDTFKLAYLDFIDRRISVKTEFKAIARKRIRPFAYFFWFLPLRSLLEKTRDGKLLKNGITAVVAAKNEESTISLCLESLLGFADQIVCIDNGSDDTTLSLMNDFKNQYSDKCEIDIVPMPGALLGDCREMGLALTRYAWHLRWDADMVFKTSGKDSAKRLKEKALTTRAPVAFQLARTHLFGDFSHTSNVYQVVDEGEPILIKLTSRIRYVEYGRFDAIKLPLYYKTVRDRSRYYFHCNGIKPDARLIYRDCYFDWRQAVNTKPGYAGISLNHFSVQWNLMRYGTNDLRALKYRFQKEYVLFLTRYNPEKFGEYPELITGFMQQGRDRFVVEYKNDLPYRRIDRQDPDMLNYIPTDEDLAFDPGIYLKTVLRPEQFILLNQPVCAE